MTKACYAQGGPQVFVVRVHGESTATNPDGNSWTNAYPFLQDGLTRADEILSDPDTPVGSTVEIWMAGAPVDPETEEDGITYYPDQDSSDPNGSCFDANGNFDSSGCQNGQFRYFRLRESVSIQGGYAGDPDNDTLRAPYSGRYGDPDGFLTILSGDIDHNDSVSIDDTAVPDKLVFTNYDNNAGSVVLAVSVGNTAILDGVSVRGGNGGVIKASGGGVNISDAEPVIRNCTIEHNIGDKDGGGIYSLAETGDAALLSPEIRGCRIYQNYAEQEGGGIFLQGAGRILDCVILGNQANDAINPPIKISGGGMQLRHLGPVEIVNSEFFLNSVFYGDGGGLSIDVATGDFEVNVTNCVFISNWAASDVSSSFPRGGGIYVQGGSNIRINGCTIYANHAVNTDDVLESEGGGIYYNNSTHALESPEQLTEQLGEETEVPAAPVTSFLANSIVWANDRGAEIYVNGSGLLDVTYSCVRGDWDPDLEGSQPYPGMGNINNDPEFLVYPEDPPRLSCDSPCVDQGNLGAGNASGFPADVHDIDDDPSTTGPTPDMDKSSRVQGSGIDMGAFEKRHGVRSEEMPVPVCTADFDGNETVNVDDLLMLIGRWGPCIANAYPCFADIDDGLGVCADETVNVDDLLELIGQWGPCPTMSGTGTQIAVGASRPEFYRDCEYECDMAVVRNEIEEDEHDACMEDCIFDYFGINGRPEW